MRYAIIAAAAALALAGCHKSLDQRFAAMCAYQKAHDPEDYAAGKDSCEHPTEVRDEGKTAMLEAYDEVLKARKALGRGAPQ